MLYLLLILLIVACVLLTLIILVQNPKGGGAAGAFGAQATQFLGARQAADFLEKATWYFGIGILVVVTATYFLTVSPSGENTQKAKVSNAADYTPATNAPGQKGGQQQGPPQGQGQPQQAPPQGGQQPPQPQQAPPPQGK